MLGTPPPGSTTPVGNSQYNSLIGSQNLLGNQQIGMTPGPQLTTSIPGIDPSQLQMLVKLLSGGAR